MSKGYTFHPTILREYDIRGQVGKNLFEQDAYFLGRAFGTFLKRKHNGTKMCVGYDGRDTSPQFCIALIKGLNESGIDVDNIGIGPTPMLYYAVKHMKADAGIMITGSHNPQDFNGFKMCLYNSSIYGETIQEIGKIAASGDFENGTGVMNKPDIRDRYVQRLMQDFTLKRPLKIAWDNGNGAAGEILQMLTKIMPGEHILMYEDIDGAFPNHHPDPTVDKNLTDLQRTVLKERCDLGIAFDGDGDRIGVVDEKGNILRCDILMTIYARDILKRNPGAAIIGDVKCSSVMFDEINRIGGKAVMWKCGHSLVKAKMAELKAPLAGELSGHIFFADGYYGYDDALYCAVRLLNALENESLSSLTKDLPRTFSTHEVRFDVEETEKFDIVPRIAQNLKGAKDISIIDIDGIRVSTPDGWWLMRPSNTQSVLSARAEASSVQGLERLKDMAKNEVAKVGYTLSFED